MFPIPWKSESLFALVNVTHGIWAGGQLVSHWTSINPAWVWLPARDHLISCLSSYPLSLGGDIKQYVGLVSQPPLTQYGELFKELTHDYWPQVAKVKVNIRGIVWEIMQIMFGICTDLLGDLVVSWVPFGLGVLQMILCTSNKRS